MKNKDRESNLLVDKLYWEQEYLRVNVTGIVPNSTGLWELRLEHLVDKDTILC